MADKTAISTLSQSAANLLKSKRYSEALPVLQSILILDPNNEGALYAIGVTFANLKRYPEAIDAYNRALKNDQNNSSTWNQRGVALFQLERYSEAIDSFTKALARSPNDASIKNNKDLASKKLNEQNLKQSNDSITRDLNRKGLGYLNQKNYSEAINFFNQALKLNPDDTVIKNNRDLAQKELEKSKIKPFRISSGIWYLILLVFIFGAVGLINQQANQTSLPPPQPTPTFSLNSLVLQPTPTYDYSLWWLPQTTPTESLSQLLQEAKKDEMDKEANSISQAIDYTNPTTRDFAVGLIKKINGGSYEEIGVNQISDIWDAIRPPHWTYVSDPLGQDYYSPASRTINLDLKGDCDDFAILNAAVVQSIHGKSRVITACHPELFGGDCHAYAEVYVSDNYSDLQSITDYLGDRYGITTVYYHKEEFGLVGSEITRYWLNLDWSANHPGGPFFTDDGTYKIFYPDGIYDVITNSEATVLTQQVSRQTLRSVLSVDTLPPDLFDTPTPKPTINVYKINLWKL